MQFLKNFEQPSQNGFFAKGMNTTEFLIKALLAANIILCLVVVYFVRSRRDEKNMKISVTENDTELENQRTGPSQY